MLALEAAHPVSRRHAEASKSTLQQIRSLLYNMENQVAAESNRQSAEVEAFTSAYRGGPLSTALVGGGCYNVFAGRRITVAGGGSGVRA